MSTKKKGFGDFVRRPAAVTGLAHGGSRDAPAMGQRPGELATPPAQSPAAEPPSGGDRIREVTSTGRVRTYSASRQLPGITLRVTEERWEKLKMMSIQERRPLQEILGEALDRYMKDRGLPW